MVENIKKARIIVLVARIVHTILKKQRNNEKESNKKKIEVF